MSKLKELKEIIEKEMNNELESWRELLQTRENYDPVLTRKKASYIDGLRFTLKEIEKLEVE